MFAPFKMLTALVLVMPVGSGFYGPDSDMRVSVLEAASRGEITIDVQVVGQKITAHHRARWGKFRSAYLQCPECFSQPFPTDAE